MIMLKKTFEKLSDNRIVRIISYDKSGNPAIEVAENIRLAGENLVRVNGWFRELTLSNVAERPKIFIEVSDTHKKKIFGLFGIIRDITEEGILDGFDPKIEEQADTPQVEWSMLVEVRKVTVLKKVDHPEESAKRDETGDPRTATPRSENEDPPQNLLRAENEGYPLYRLFDKKT